MPLVPPKQGNVNGGAKSEPKPPWVRNNSTETVRKVVIPPPAATANKQPEDVPWRKPNLRKTAVPEPSATAPPEPLKTATKPEWAKAETRSPVGPSEKVVGKAGAGPEKGPVVKTIPIVQAETTKPKPVQEKVVRKPPPSTHPAPTPPQPQPTQQANKQRNMPNGKAPPPPPPPPSSGPPPPPPPPGMMNGSKPPVPTKTPEQLAKVEQLRKLSRRRPDPYTLMKEIQSGKKLKHVECNDRSKPIIPRMKSLGKFVFDSEAKPASKTDAIHNKLLDQIQSGIKLKKVVTNDRSKPVLGGLRKFRRQDTLEGKGGVGTILEEADKPVRLSDDIDDIDILRDDLQSAKQMLEMEIQGKVQLGKVNQDLQCQIITLEAEIEKMKAQLGIIPENQVSAIVRRNSRAFKDIRKSRSGLYRSSSGIKKSKSGVGDKGPAPPDLEEDALEEVSELEEEINALKGLVQIARTSAEDWEAKYKEASQKLLLAQGNFEDSEQKRLLLEKKLEISQSRKGVSAVSTVEKTTQTEEQASSQERRTSKQLNKGSSFQYESNSEDDASDVEMDEATITKKKEEREIKLWENKLKSFKEKQNSSQIERKNLKAQQKKLEQELKDSKVSHKALQKEVDKMAKALKESAEGSGDEEESEEEESEEEESEEEESESEESEESEPEAEVSSSEEDDSDEEHEERLALFTKRVKRHENILNALKKGNYLLKANIDRLMDNLEEVKIRYKELEHELNTVLNAC